MLMMIATIIVPILILVFGLVFLQARYKRCPSNKVLVVYGRVGADKASKCIHGGGTFVLPLIQDFAYLSLEPMSLNIDLKGALSKENIRVHVPSTFTVAISTEPEVLQNAAQRLLGLRDEQIAEQASEIIFGQFRQAIATMTIDEINQHRDKLLELVNNNVGTELRKVGLEVINVNIRDLSDEAGYIQAIGKRAAAEAVNKASIEVAEQKKIGDIGVATADRDREVTTADLKVKTTIGQAQAAATQRIETATLNANAVTGENASKAKIAEANAALRVREAKASQEGEVAQAEAQTAILKAQKDQQTARLEMEMLAKQEVEKKRIQLEAEAEAEKVRIIAKAKAEANWLEKEAEAKGIKAILDAKADGYKNLITVAKENAPTLLTIEQLPTLVKAQVEAIKGIKIDKVTVWDSGGSNGGSTANFFQGMVKALPPLHDIAKSAGLNLPDFLGNVEAPKQTPPTTNGKVN